MLIQLQTLVQLVLFSSYANVSGTVNGILIRNTKNFAVSYNTITSSVGGVTSGTLNGIQQPAFSNTPTGQFQILLVIIQFHYNLV